MFFLLALFFFFSPLQAESIYVGHPDLKAISILERGQESSSSFLPLRGYAPQKMFFREESAELYVLLKDTSLIQIVDVEEKMLGRRLDLLQTVEDFTIQGSLLFLLSAEDIFAFDLQTDTFLYGVSHKLEGASRIAVSEDGLWAFVTGNNGTLFMLDLEQKIGTHHQIDREGHLLAVALIPDSTTLCALSSGYDYDLILFDYVSGKIQTFPLINLVEGGDALCISPDKEFLYILGSKTANVGKFHLGSKSLEKTLPVGLESSSMDLTQDGSFLYVASKKEKKLVVIYLSSFQYADEMSLSYDCSCVFVEPLDPIEGLVAEQTYSRFLLGEKYTNVLQWKSREEVFISHYMIYKNGVFFRSIPGDGAHVFRDERIRKAEKIVYEIVAVSRFGTFSKKYRVEVG